MRQTLSQIKEQQRKQIAVRDKLVYLEKASNGQIVDVHILQWVAEQFLPELQRQATLNKQDYELQVRTEQDKKELLQLSRIVFLEEEIKQLQIALQDLKHEIAIIKGEEE